jgi:hypothetical protein
MDSIDRARETMDSATRDRFNCECYVVNGAIITIWEYTGERPTTEQVRANCNVATECKLITDEQIEDIVKRVSRFFK